MKAGKIKRLTSIFICLYLGLLLFFPFVVAGAEEPAEATPPQYEIDESVECTGYTDFSNPITFEDSEDDEYKCFIIDLDGARWRVAVSEDYYPYVESAFKGKPMTFEGKYKGVASDGMAVVNPTKIIEGENRVDLSAYLWQFNMGSLDDLNFAVYKDLFDTNFMTIGEDSSYMEFDTNPSNLPSDGILGIFAEVNTVAATKILEGMNKDFGLPGWLYEEMLSTRALDGKQKEVFDYLTVSWTYHPDQGLEILYRKN